MSRSKWNRILLAGLAGLILVGILLLANRPAAEKTGMATAAANGGGGEKRSKPLALEQGGQAQPGSVPVSRPPLPGDDFRLERKPDGRIFYKPAMDASRRLDPGADAAEDGNNVLQVISHYRYAYKENPVGPENRDVTRAMLGENPKNIVFVASDSPWLAGEELVDRWGTPYFFHALSGTNMEVRSGGPDRQLWTADDIVVGESAPDPDQGP